MDGTDAATTTISKELLACARAAYGANRAYCIAIGDNSFTSWEDAPDWQKESLFNGVARAIKGNTPEESHESWLALKEAAGWVYGEVKDPGRKQHPNMVPYSELPDAQKAKDDIFIAVARAMAEALGL